METVTVSSNGQITIPMPILQKLGLREGSRLTVIEQDNGVMLAAEPSEKKFSMSEEEIQAAVKRGWTREYLETMIEIWNSPSDPTFMVHPDAPHQDRGELFNEVFP